MVTKAFRALPKKRVAGQVPIDIEKRFRRLAAELDLPRNAALTEALKMFIDVYRPGSVAREVNHGIFLAEDSN